MSHNTYGLYVNHEGDLVGLVAYSLYKQHKIAFLDQEIKKTSAKPSQDQIDMFCSVFNTQQHVDLLRAKAEELLEAMNEVLLDDTVEGLHKQYRAKLVAELKEGPSFGKTMWYSIAGNLATAAFVALVVFGASTSANGFVSTLGNWTGYTITAK